jgi:hypothetical protein
MYIWILRPQEGLNDNDNPWKPWHNKSFGFVIRAKNEEEARKIADDNARCENDDTSNPWLDSKYSTCVKLTHSGEAGLIISDFASD